MSELQAIADGFQAMALQLGRIADVMERTNPAVSSPRGAQPPAADADKPTRGRPRKDADTRPSKGPTEAAPAEPEEVVDAAKDAQAEEPEGASYDECRMLVARLTKEDPANGRDRAIATLNQFRNKDNPKAKAGRVSEVAEADYQALFDALTAELEGDANSLD